MSHPAVIPTRVLPGWPEVYEPTLFDSFVVILGIPLAIAAVVTLALMGPHWFRKAQGTELERVAQ